MKPLEKGRPESIAERTLKESQFSVVQEGSAFIRFLQILYREKYSLFLWGGLAIGIFLRVWNLGYVEFKGDEFTSIVLAYKNLHEAVALVGNPASFGLHHPPFFIYLLSLPVALSTNPVFVTSFIIVLNVAGLIALYFFLRRVFSADIALAAASVLATAPWSIILSRKIWNPDIIFPFLILFFWCLALYLEKRRLIFLLIASFALAVVTQAHLSGLLLVPLLGLSALFYRMHIRWRDVTAAAGVFILLYVPYILYFFQPGADSVTDFFVSRIESEPAPLVDGIIWSFNITTGFQFSYLMGPEEYDAFYKDYNLALPLLGFVVYASIALLALVWHLWRVLPNLGKYLRREYPSVQEQIIGTILFFFVGVHAFYYLLNVPAYPHYYLITYPALPLLFALYLFWMMKKYPLIQGLLRGAIVLVVLANSIFSLSFYDYVKEQGPDLVKGDYGIPYIFEKERWEQNLQNEFSETRP